VWCEGEGQGGARRRVLRLAIQSLLGRKTRTRRRSSCGAQTTVPVAQVRSHDQTQIVGARKRVRSEGDKSTTASQSDSPGLESSGCLLARDIVILSLLLFWEHP
jgi:hypothetical protein